MKKQSQQQWRPFVYRIDDQQTGRRTRMKRLLVTFAALALLALPVVAGADDTSIPPQLNWTPTPPAQRTREAVGIALAEFLVKKGMLTPQEGSELTEVRPPLPTWQGDGGLSQRMLEYLTSH